MTLLWCATLWAQPRGPHGRPPWAGHRREAFLRNLAHRAEELLEEASRKGVAEEDSQKAALLRLGMEQLREGLRALKLGQYGLAFRLLDQARFLGKFLVGRKPRGLGMEEIVRGSRLILRQIRELGCPPPPWLEEAEALQREAEEDIRQGRYEEARWKVRKLRRLLFMSLRDLHPSPEKVGEVVERTEGMLRRWGKPILDSGVPDAIAIFESAFEHQKRAEEALKSERLKEALLQTHVATRMLLRAMSLAGITPE